LGTRLSWKKSLKDVELLFTYYLGGDILEMTEI